MGGVSLIILILHADKIIIKMNPFRSIVIALLLVSFNCSAKNLNAIFSYSKFNSEKSGPFIETYLSVTGNSVNYVPLNGAGYQSVITINLVFKDSAGKAVYNDAYNLNSPVITDTNATAFNFIDQQRIPVSNGKYTLIISITDKNGNGKTSSVSDTLLVDFNTQKVSVSDITFLDSYKKTETETIFSKSGYDLIPYVDNFYPKNIKSLKFYCEIYNTALVLGAETPYLLSYYILNTESKMIMDDFNVIRKQKADSITVILSEFNISELPSGNYQVVVELRNKNNEVISQSARFFQRSNSDVSAKATSIENIRVDNTFIATITDRDTLADYIACLRPISNPQQTMWHDNQLKTADARMMQQFFYDFWYKKNPADPNQAWQIYKAQVNAINEFYGDRFNKGYTTERGRVHLQYGPPNSIDRHEHEPDAYPYEIWHYYKIKNQTNKKFVFYNPNLAGNDYRLLHSDMTGEVNNPSWNIDLYKRNTPNTNLDNTKRIQNMGNQSQDAFDVPK